MYEMSQEAKAQYEKLLEEIAIQIDTNDKDIERLGSMGFQPTAIDTIRILQVENVHLTKYRNKLLLEFLT